MIDLLRVSHFEHGARVTYEDNRPTRPPQQRPFIIPVFIPQAGCPHRCAFCNQHTITGAPDLDDDPAALQGSIHQFLKYRRSRQRFTQIAFFGGNFLGLSPERARRYLDGATAFVRRGEVDNLRFSTRPDTISPDSLSSIRDYPVGTVELGVQSMDDDILARSRRGHRTAKVIQAVAQLKAAGYEIGLQIMTGLPGETPHKAEATVRRVLALAPAFVRIYPTLVLAGSPLAADYKAGRYRPPGLEASVQQVAGWWLQFAAAGIRVVRMGLQTSPALADPAHVLAGPYHPAFGEQVGSHIFLTMAEAALDRRAPLTGRAALRVNPRRVSAMTGLRKSNLTRLRHRYHLQKIRVTADETQPGNQLEVDNR